MQRVSAYCYASFISLAATLLLNSAAGANSCTLSEVDNYIQKLSADESAIDKIEKCGSSAVPALVNALRVANNEVIRSRSARALAEIGIEAKVAVPTISEALQDKSNNVRSEVAFALGDIGIRNDATTLALLKILYHDTNDRSRAAAAYALGKIGSGNKAVIPALVEALGDRNSEIRSYAVFAIGDLGGEGKEVVSLLIDLLSKDDASEVRAGAAYTLGRISETNRITIEALIKALADENDRVRLNTTKALTRIAATLDSHAVTMQQIDEALISTSQIQEALNKTEFTEQKLSVASIRDKLTLRKESLSTYSLKQLVDNGKNVWFAHAAFWVALIFIYPRFKPIQAIFFWNPWVRNILGLGYVSFLLTWVPFLRRKLFEPFKPSLLADAGLSYFDPNAYFPESEINIPGSNQTQPITDIVPAIKGQLVLEGDSGLGKSMFLRHLVQQSKRIVVFLPAQKCDKGVIEAIQAKLHGDEIKDLKFLQNLIYSGAIDICIDGLNEVTADTRAKITQFVESYFKGNIIMTTQPLEWTPPSTAKTYVLQPLKREQIEHFLQSRQFRLPKDSKLQGKEYEQACIQYLNSALDSTQPSEELAAIQRVLSNPMDLTIVAQMLAQGKTPDLFYLQEQQYKLMAEEYQQMWKRDFPLKKFAEKVYTLRLNDEKALPANDFEKELLCMEDEKYKMVVSRQWQDADGKAKKEWYFRHDKIAEFFIVQTFLGQSEDAENRLKQHMDDPRFRGVYFLLATLLPLDAAQQLREDLIQYAADTKDHTVSDTFVQLLRSRKIT